MNVIEQVLISVISGCGGALLIEIWIKPYQARRWVTRALAAEIQFNINTAKQILREFQADALPSQSPFSTIAFRSTVEQLGLLGNAVQPLIEVYKWVDLANGMISVWERVTDRSKNVLAAESGYSAIARYAENVFQENMSSVHGTYREQLELIIEHGTVALKEVSQFRKSQL